MLLNRQQLALSLCTLLRDDYELLNDIIIDYCDSINDKKFNDLEEYVNNNLNELI